MSDLDDEDLYETVNKGLLRRRRTGSSCTKKLNKNGPFVSFDDYEFDPDDFLGPDWRIKLHYEQSGDDSPTSDLSHITISDEKREELLSEHFERIRVLIYEEWNGGRERLGLQPWYILTKEELDLVGLCIPYSLSIYPYRSYVRARIKQEGERIKELRAKGIAAKPWSTWKEDE
jgi:hypothetical protein